MKKTIAVLILLALTAQAKSKYSSDHPKKEKTVHVSHAKKAQSLASQETLRLL